MKLGGSLGNQLLMLKWVLLLRGPPQEEASVNISVIRLDRRNTRFVKEGELKKSL
jgi:hypothetical protein